MMLPEITPEIGLELLEEDWKELFETVKKLFSSETIEKKEAMALSFLNNLNEIVRCIFKFSDEDNPRESTYF